MRHATLLLAAIAGLAAASAVPAQTGYGRPTRAQYAAEQGMTRHLNRDAARDTAGDYDGGGGYDQGYGDQGYGYDAPRGPDMEAPDIDAPDIDAPDIDARDIDAMRAELRAEGRARHGYRGTGRSLPSGYDRGHDVPEPGGY